MLGRRAPSVEAEIDQIAFGLAGMPDVKSTLHAPNEPRPRSRSDLRVGRGPNFAVNRVEWVKVDRIKLHGVALEGNLEGRLC